MKKLILVALCLSFLANSEMTFAGSCPKFLKKGEVYKFDPGNIRKIIELYEADGTCWAEVEGSDQEIKWVNVSQAFTITTVKK